MTFKASSRIIGMIFLYFSSTPLSYGTAAQDCVNIVIKSAPQNAEKPHIKASPVGEVNTEVSFLFFKGPKIDLSSMAPIIERVFYVPLEDMKNLYDIDPLFVAYNEEAGVGAIVSLNGFAHADLKALIPEGTLVLGGTRYYGTGRHKNSVTFDELPGIEVEKTFFDVKISD